VSATEPGGRVRVPRFGHGSRVPGWDTAVDLTKDPATIPDPATTPVPAQLRERIVQAMAKYPDRRSAAIPALHAAQEEHGWCSPEAIDQVAAVMRVTPVFALVLCRSPPNIRQSCPELFWAAASRITLAASSTANEC